MSPFIKTGNQLNLTIISFRFRFVYQSIDSITRQIRFITPPDYENPQDGNTDNVYEVTVLVCDAENLCDPESATITILRDNDNDGFFDAIEDY